MPECPEKPTHLSRRALLAVAGAAPLVCAVGDGSAVPEADTLIGRCAQWLALDFESDALARRWAALETRAVAAYDYFRMNDRERLSLPMGPEMAAIEDQLDSLFTRRKWAYRAITQIAPTNLHEAASLIVIAARIEIQDPGPTAPLVRKAMDVVAKGTCARCGEPYVPKSLPTA
jgi:hypothetical protein